MKKNKIFIIFILFFIIFNLFISVCFASEESEDKTYTISYNGTVYTFPNYVVVSGTKRYITDCNYVIFYTAELDTLFLCLSPAANFNSIQYINNYYMRFKDKSGNDLHEIRLRFNRSTNNWDLHAQGSDGALSTFPANGVFNTITPTQYFYASSDVTSNNGTVFFQRTPLLKMGIIAQAVSIPMEEETITTTLVGLAKLLIPLLICLVAFWKAWGLLLKILHQA